MTLVQARAWLSETLKKAERLIRADPATFGGLTFVEQGVFVGDAKLTIPEAARYPDKIMTPFIVWEL